MYPVVWQKTLARLNALNVKVMQNPQEVCTTLRMYQSLYEMTANFVSTASLGDRSFYLSSIETLYHTLYQLVQQMPSVALYRQLQVCYDAFSAYSVRIAREEVWEQAVLYVEKQIGSSDGKSQSDYYLTLQLIHLLWSGVEWPSIDPLPVSLAYLQTQQKAWNISVVASVSESVYESMLRQALCFELQTFSVQSESEAILSFQACFQSCLATLQQRSDYSLVAVDVSYAEQLVELLHRYPMLSDPDDVSRFIEWLPQQPSFPVEGQQIFTALAFEDHCLQTLQKEQQSFWETAVPGSFLSLSR